MTTYTRTNKPCKTCGATERYADGKCRPCKREADRAVHENGPRSISPGVFFLAALPGDRKQIMAATGLSEATVYRWQRILRASGEVHIGSYRKVGGRPDPTYVAGPGRDAKPQPKLWPVKKSRAMAVKKPKPAPKPKAVAKLQAITRARVDARIALRRPVPVTRLVDAAVMQSRAAFPLCAVWG